ncbi:hypothetical protein [Brevibacillus daliensis]|uniref:hypothetical protein n=1 Tax=Brevibacillus daliensis TaxID=2892995 RepID=UPI001E6327C6|nr:hypothetical protein [Brevibacillus daliensis]
MQYSTTVEEQEQWQQLKQKLVQPSIGIEPEQASKVIIIINLYHSAGASFIASNYAWLESQKKLTTLCEHPLYPSYYYFALDIENRKYRTESTSHEIFSSTKTAVIEEGRLLIPVTHLPDKLRLNKSHAELLSWFFTWQKQSTLLVLDLSSNWKEEGMELILQWADEVWIVLDTNFPRLAQLMATEAPPPFWQKIQHKSKYVINRWNTYFDTKKMRNKVLGTLSLWNNGNDRDLYLIFIQQVCAEHLGRSQLEGKIYCEAFPQNSEVFEPLMG